ncbi:hypothetical protein F5B19DRAFT_107321 [Rostrohypoxylon terebratum]|nr:hypothetical protein F5B19DRAFT_107321 [Rostrohypoxylon terebratum]
MMSVCRSNLRERTRFISLLEPPQICVSFSVIYMATKKDEPAKGTKPSHPKAVDGAEEDEQWNDIELPDPDDDWEKVYQSHANPHIGSIDYYTDECLIEMPFEDDWMGVDHLPEESQKEQKGERVYSTYHAGERIKRMLAKKRAEKMASQQREAQDSTSDYAPAAGARSKFRMVTRPGPDAGPDASAGASGIANRRDPPPGATYVKGLDGCAYHKLFYQTLC